MWIYVAGVQRSEMGAVLRELHQGSEPTGTLPEPTLSTWVKSVLTDFGSCSGLNPFTIHRV
ncbi:unnamed protein product [Linum tenue]|uniref:Uncharacterized protein n=1 Tax=Linum tenue TaxID=586396 RepID=A0AAV0MK52_9ROSI|nr:unnamed protein product [Linum tenue]